LLHALRSQLPDAYLAALVTRYNAAVLAGNPDLDALHSYTKAKHRAEATASCGFTPAA
jgi:ADP-heptose:LPS heptosyltransferase